MWFSFAIFLCYKERIKAYQIMHTQTCQSSVTTYKQTPRKGANFPDLPVIQPNLVIPENTLYQCEFLGSAAQNVPHIQGVKQEIN